MGGTWVDTVEEKMFIFSARNIRNYQNIMDELRFLLNLHFIGLVGRLAYVPLRFTEPPSTLDYAITGMLAVMKRPLADAWFVSASNNLSSQLMSAVSYG